MTDCVPLADWKSRLQEMADRADDPESRVLLHSLDSVEGYLSDISRYDISRYSEVIAEIGLTMPEVDVDYMTMFLGE